MKAGPYILLQNQVCLDFDEVTSEGAPEITDGYRLSFYRDTGCFSPLGMYTGNAISIGIGCDSDSTIQHEVMHSLGFHHEQIRPDRDGYVSVHFENIIEGREAQFNKISQPLWIDQNINYDIASVMQYGGYGFSSNGNPTITVVKNGVDTGVAVVEQRNGASSMDIWQICKLYECGKCNGVQIDSYRRRF